MLPKMSSTSFVGGDRSVKTERMSPQQLTLISSFFTPGMSDVIVMLLCVSWMSVSPNP